MSEDSPQSPVSPQLKRLQHPEQSGMRTFLRIMGPLVLMGGILCFGAGAIGMFVFPPLFFLAFVGAPLMFVGGVMSQFGYMGAVARYVAGEGDPVAADTINYLADETKGAVEAVARSAAKGIAEGIEAGRESANFCPHCGALIKADFRFCPKCGKSTIG